MSEDVKKIAEELVIACKRAYTRGIQTGSGGNVSARVPERFDDCEGKRQLFY